MKKQIKGISVQLGSNDVDNNIEERQRLNDQYKTKDLMSFFRLNNYDFLTELNNKVKVITVITFTITPIKKKTLKKKKVNNIINNRKERMELQLQKSENEKKIELLEKENTILYKNERMLKRKIEKDTLYISKQSKEINRLKALLSKEESNIKKQQVV